MKNKWLMLCSAAALALVLTACGSTGEGNEDPPITQPTETPATDVEVADDGDKEVIEEAPSAQSTDKDDKANDQTSDVPEEATLTESDEQEFSIYLLPDFTLTSEEPGRDIVYSEADEAIFMRIETTIDEEGAYDFFKENVIATLEASSNGEEPVELTDSALLPSSDGIENVKGYAVDAETGKVTGIVFKRDNLIVKLTIFDSPQSNKTSKFLQMGETVTYSEKTVSIQ